MSGRYQNRIAAERLDVLEDPRDLPSTRGCNVSNDGVRCRLAVVVSGVGPFGTRNLCSKHRAVYAEHDRILERIRAIPCR